MRTPRREEARASSWGFTLIELSGVLTILSIIVEVPAEPEPGATESPGVYDVHSASDGTSSDGSPYNEW